MSTEKRRFGYWLPATLVVGLLLGVAIGFLVPRGEDLPADDSAEAGFARDMSTHHSQAVEMGMIAYTRATNDEVRMMARDIALTQQGQIGMFQAWLREWNLQPTGSKPAMSWMPGGAESVKDGLMPGMATPEELKQLREATGLDEDRLFMKLMINHHLGGIHMAQEVVELSDDPEVVESAQLSINSQQRDLTDMQDLQKRLDTAS
ncbi:DUF305 domain-containing protein [Actinoplanes hulinensis]|uniref:DUF305 domain-containing protein n=1 Tax=Actinoplanes hulinensis TaxID=1144547 RepID=A0ABS7BCW9_9ACTN|nr:DUF305 domain-containing protein [Actinoplanes hulinensis]MBW6438910.1 DUF305 domain-containing protein [Actinoplanes hulinensis]